ncbi:MAG TPA: hypothetical protein VK666_25350, partial [Chryseolinea sp.]|nr:hypothetical protein [Chryseolinea sp.]
MGAICLTGMNFVNSTYSNEFEAGSKQNIGIGQMPNVATDSNGNIHLVFGKGDSIMYSSSTDKGISFSRPELVSTLPELAASHMRGPQIASTENGLTIIACNMEGDIYSFNKSLHNQWSKSGRVNDVDTVAKENFIAITADGDNAFAVWLDLRGDHHNKIYGS